MELVVGDPEAGVAHAQRIEQALAEEVAQRLTRQDLDQAGGDVDADAVVPAGAGLECEGERGQLVDQCVERDGSHRS